MKKILFLSFLCLINLGHYAFADDRSVQDAFREPDPEGTVKGRQPEYKQIDLTKVNFYLEPILSVSQEDTSITSQSARINDDSTGNSKGYGLGARFGARVADIFFAGADARYAKMQTDDSFYNKADSDIYNIGPSVGWQTPLLGLRLLATYVVAGENNPTSGMQGVDLKFKEATGMRFGAGFLIKAVSVNLEYQDLTYNSTDIQSYGALPVNSLKSVDANTRGYALSVSFPVTF